MATYLDTPEMLISPNGQIEWRVAFDPADESPEIASTRVVLLMRPGSEERFSSDAKDVYETLGALALHDREAVYALLLDGADEVFGVYVIGMGGPSATVVDKISLMRSVLAADPAGGVVLVHNHPSGNADLSREDVALTKEVVQILAYFGYELRDHVVLAAEGYMSMRGAGLL